MSFEIHTRRFFDAGDEVFASAKSPRRNVRWQRLSAILATGALIALAVFAIDH
jgi:hypothetical protein